MVPIELLLLCAGVAGLGLVVSNWSDDDDENPAVDDPDTGPVAPHEGTEGDDTVTTYDYQADEDGVLSVLGGDDLVDLAAGTLATGIDLGAGDDTLRGDGAYIYGSVDGGDGDDLIETDDVDGDAYSGDSNSISGGAGDDTIVGYMRDNRVFGGDGDDVIQVNEAHLTIYDNLSLPPILDGGAGEDSFIVGVSADSALIAEYGNSNSEINFDAPVARIDDFRPGEDELMIDPTTYAGSVSFLGYEIVPGDGTNSIVMTFADPHDPTLTMPLTITVNSAAPLTAADIRIINAGTAAGNV